MTNKLLGRLKCNRIYFRNVKIKNKGTLCLKLLNTQYKVS